MNATDMIKVWIFYLINSDSDVMGIEINDIYAFTDKKDLAKNFINTRNMKKFYTKKMKLSRSEFNNLLKNNLACELGYIKGTTRDDEYHIRDFKIAATKREKMFCNNDETVYIHEYLYKYVWNDPNLFLDKYHKALIILGYVTLHDMVIGENLEEYSKFTEKLHPDTFNMLLSHVRELFVENTLDNESEES